MKDHSIFIGRVPVFDGMVKKGDKQSYYHNLDHYILDILLPSFLDRPICMNLDICFLHSILQQKLFHQT